MTKKLCFLIALAFAPAAALATYKCVDEKGVTRIGETPPDECANVVMYEMSSSGTILKKIDPTPTADQLRQREAEADKRKEADKVLAEKKRKDMALVSTYATEREFDVARDRNIDPINGRIKVTKERLAGVDKRVKELEDEMEFYKAGKRTTTTSKSNKKGGSADGPPHMLTEDLHRLKTERAVLEKSLVGYDKEIEALRVKYDIDKQRWLEIKNTGNKPRDDPKGPTTITLSAGAAGIAKCGDKVYECPAGNQYICRDGRKEFKVNCVVPSAGSGSPVSR
ncbi:MAG TPA: DUF4124 domain-containing protein [Usitatibacter sp.]|nr:DUF4124 domain-containing protein [Usitatibacter sp.]